MRGGPPVPIVSHCQTAPARKPFCQLPKSGRSLDARLRWTRILLHRAGRARWFRRPRAQARAGVFSSVRSRPGYHCQHGARGQHRPAGLCPLVRAAADRGPRLVHQRLRLRGGDRRLRRGARLPRLGRRGCWSTWSSSWARRRPASTAWCATTRSWSKPSASASTPPAASCGAYARFKLIYGFAGALPQVQPRMAPDRARVSPRAAVPVRAGLHLLQAARARAAGARSAAARAARPSARLEHRRLPVRRERPATRTRSPRSSAPSPSRRTTRPRCSTSASSCRRPAGTRRRSRASPARSS